MVGHLFVHISEKLWIEINDIRVEKRLTWSDTIDYLCNNVERPLEKQNNYIPYFSGNKMKHVNIRVSDETEVKFRKFANVFNSYYHALDYLVQFGRTNSLNLLY